MPQSIELLPEHVANQIAAGEVIQRPASVVKELLENAVDAGATQIRLIIREGGRNLIQVIDNGSGMNALDARLAFSRHATSKIRKADDLWQIRTMGFRGEALASMAAVAMVEMKTRQHHEELGTLIEIEGSDVVRQEACACQPGTSIAIKNLFYNVPARRNFLKSNTVEVRHIFDEFQRVALAFPDVGFSLISNEEEIFRLQPANLKQRITGLFGASWNEKLLPLSEETSLVKITGFTGKPEFARKSRGEQFFFVNNRFIRNNYLHHAVVSAYEALIQQGSYPSYFIFLETDPASIDVNIHPTKTEIKFEDDRSVYAILRSAVKKSIGSYSLSPRLDFDQNPAFEISLPPRNGGIPTPGITVNTGYNPFETQRQRNEGLEKISRARWDQLAFLDDEKLVIPGLIEPPAEQTEKGIPTLLHGRYILTQVKSGLMIIDQFRARERILFERFADEQGSRGASQQLLFPVVKEFSAPDFELISSLDEELRAIGFSIEAFGTRTLLINGIPPDIKDQDPGQVIDQLIEQVRRGGDELRLKPREALAAKLAALIAKTTPLQANPQSLLGLIEQLFSCKITGYSPTGKTIVELLSLEELSARFGKS
jgi:DNA mismatch repair protein MutL